MPLAVPSMWCEGIEPASWCLLPLRWICAYLAWAVGTQGEAGQDGPTTPALWGFDHRLVIPKHPRPGLSVITLRMQRASTTTGERADPLTGADKPRFGCLWRRDESTCLKLLFAGGLVMAPVSGHTADVMSLAASDRVQAFGDYYSAGSKSPSTSHSSALTPTSLSLRGFGGPHFPFPSSKWTASKAPGPRW
jgi:hypothetical protein